jgi:hypothetical protein
VENAHVESFVESGVPPGAFTVTMLSPAAPSMMLTAYRPQNVSAAKRLQKSAGIFD